MAKFRVVLSAQFDFVVAVAAVNRSVFAGFEGDFGFLAALGTYYREHLPGRPIAVSIFAIALRFPCLAAFGTAFRLVLEAT